jgi:hypothetical protein
MQIGDFVPCKQLQVVEKSAIQTVTNHFHVSELACR